MRQYHPLTIEKLSGDSPYQNKKRCVIISTGYPCMRAVPGCYLLCQSLLMVIQHPICCYFIVISAASNSSSFGTIPGCILTISIQPHPPLQKVMHLFPEHVVMTTDDVIPGIIDSNTQDG